MGGENSTPAVPSPAEDCTWGKAGSLQGLPGVLRSWAGGPVRAPPPAEPRLHCVFLAVRQTRRLRFARSVDEAAFTRGSEPTPTPGHQHPTAPGAPWPGSTSPFTSSRLGRRKDRPICNIQAYQTRTLKGRSRPPPGRVPIGCTPH